ncbi:PIN domain-containing protein [Schwartzia succinivorans]|uniref:PIN domain-containing protein n=1 Tax=Schwartzia succinivorans DSM 10502 TaxID=1123243 RepID=A0A1M4XD53_9FIRM|nr:PIN domain-containing protein [Schwartzia succinivorans]SHE91444.1 PIN domain-containing protein [Schwartzia succinivorans DSM 10502]
MNLGKARIAYPFVEYSVQVTHHTERKSTVMEWMLLEIAQKVESYPDYAAIPLENILTSIFSVADGNILLRQVLIDLVDVNALEQIPGFSDKSEWNQLRCGDLRLTDDGRRLQQEGKLPAKSQTQKLSVVYDVVNNRLVNSSKGMVDNTVSPKAKDIGEGNMPGFPSSLIALRIEEWQADGQNAPSWLQRNSRIDNIVPEGDAKIKWQNISHEISIDSRGNLSLLGAPNDEIAEVVLKDTDLGTMPDYELPLIDVDTLLSKRKCAIYDKTSDTIESYAAKANIFVVAPQFSNIIDEKNNKVCLLLGQLSFGFDATGKNTVISLPDAFPEGLCYQDISRSVYATAVEGHIGAVSRLIPYIYEDVSDFSVFVISLVKKYYMLDRRMLKLLNLVGEEKYREFYTADYIRDLLNSAEIQQLTPIDKILDRLLKLDVKLQNVLVDVPISASSETIRSALLGKDVEILGDVREWTAQWREALESLKTKTDVDVKSMDWQGTNFGLSLERMEQAADAVAVFYDDSASRYSKVYVFDTCSLMHYPDVLDDFVSNKALVIIPKQVLVELDGLKTADDENRRYQARQAIRKIHEYGDEPWLKQNEDNYLELLSDSFRESGIKDFYILSVAVKYRVKNPVMVTDDENFQNFAQSEGVETITAHNLHEKLTNEVSSKGKGKNKKKRK